MKTIIAMTTKLLLVMSATLFLTNIAIAEPMLHAFLVGIGHYNDKKIKTLYDQPSEDVASMEHFIRKNFKGKKSFYILKDSAATKNEIINKFIILTNSVSAGDHVIFYYSGHGDQVPDDNNDEKDGQDEVLVNADAVFKGGILHNIIRDDELDALLKKIEAKDVYVQVIIDSCHSGTIAKSTTPSFSVAKQVNQIYQQRRQEKHVVLSANPKRTVWTAAAAGQVSFGGMQLKNSFYTTLLIEAVNKKLADYNKNGMISNSEVHRYLLDFSNKFCSVKSECMEGLTPTLEIYASYTSQPFLFTPNLAKKQPVKATTAETVFTMIDESFAQNLSDTIKIKLKHKNKTITLKDELFVELESDIKGHLILLDVDAKGKMVQIFPNAQHPDNKIKSGKKYYFPTDAQQSYGFFATEKGKSRLYAIVTHDPINLKGVLTKDLKPTAIDKPVNYIGELTKELNAPWTNENITRLSRYSVAAIDYTVH